MLPKYHIIYGLIFAAIVFLFFPDIGLIGFTLIFLSSFLIDVDHYLFYAFTHKDRSLKNAREWFMKKRDKALKLSKKDRRQILQIPCIFHGIETVLILIFLSLFFPIFIYILIGLIFHQILDLLSIFHYNFPFHHIGSQTYNILNYRKNQ
jgi:hypothetical protein